MIAEQNPREQEPSSSTQETSLFKEAPKLGRKGKIHRLMKGAPEVYRKVVMFIEQGCYDYVAAEAMGVTADTWRKWMRRGEEEAADGKNTYYARFFRDISMASARARLMAELEVRRDDPKFFLTHGPGKPRPNRPGWSNRVEVAGDADSPLSLEVADARPDSAPVEELGTAIALMEELGLIHATPEGRQIIDALPSPRTDDPQTGVDLRPGDGAPEPVSHLSTEHPGNGAALPTDEAGSSFSSESGEDSGAEFIPDSLQSDDEDLYEDDATVDEGHNPLRGVSDKDIDPELLPPEFR